MANFSEFRPFGQKNFSACLSGKHQNLFCPTASKFRKIISKAYFAKGQMNKPLPSDCLYCGNNPVPHFLYWYFESLNILFGPIRRSLTNSWLARILERLAERLNIALWFVKTGLALKVLSINNKPENCRIQRAKVLWEEAEKRAMVMGELLLFGKPFDTYLVKLESNDRKLVFSGLPRPKGFSHENLDWMDDKWLFKKKMRHCNLPVPCGSQAWNFRQAKRAFHKLIKPVVVKPRAGSRGRHSTTNVNTLDELEQAYLTAKQLSFWVVVEECLSGPVYRATLINYELCGALRGDPPSIIGNGISTIAELVEIKNKLSRKGVKEIFLDEAKTDFLKRQNLSLNSVLKPGKKIFLTEKIGVNYGGSSSEDYEICHKDNKDLFVSAAKIVNDPIVGFDFIIPDITQSWKTQNCGFIEANSLPFINLHHNPLHGRPRNIAAKVWDMLKWDCC